MDIEQLAHKKPADLDVHCFFKTGYIGIQHGQGKTPDLPVQYISKRSILRIEDAIMTDVNHS